MRYSKAVEGSGYRKNSYFESFHNKMVIGKLLN